MDFSVGPDTPTLRDHLRSLPKKLAVSLRRLSLHLRRRWRPCQSRRVSRSSELAFLVQPAYYVDALCGSAPHCSASYPERGRFRGCPVLAPLGRVWGVKI